MNIYELVSALRFSLRETSSHCTPIVQTASSASLRRQVKKGDENCRKLQKATNRRGITANACIEICIRISIDMQCIEYITQNVRYFTSLSGRRKNSPCCRTNSLERYPPRARMATGKVIYCGPPSGFMTSPYVSVTKAHMVEIMARIEMSHFPLKCDISKYQI